MIWPLAALLAGSCAPAPHRDLATAAIGMSKAGFLSCSGPPSIAFPQGDQERMSFVTNLKGGQMIGINNPTAFPVESCSVDALFVRDRLASANFSGNMSMCDAVFTPCLGK